MREIKFRAWQRGQMHISPSISDGLHHLGGWFKAHSIYGFNNDGESKIMQYTGLKDKNGKEIYEGDIVDSYTTSFQQYDCAEVRFANGGFQFYLPNGQIVLNVDTTVYRVIGNIYQNSELLLMNFT